MTVQREYAGRRTLVTAAIAEKLRKIDGTGSWLRNISGVVHTRLRFPNEINEFPFVSVTATDETRNYLGGGRRDRYLQVIIRVYVQEEDSLVALDKILEDIETALEGNTKLDYIDRQGNPQQILNIELQQIMTDEGALEPMAIAEMVIKVQY